MSLSEICYFYLLEDFSVDRGTHYYLLIVEQTGTGGQIISYKLLYSLFFFLTVIHFNLHIYECETLDAIR